MDDIEKAFAEFDLIVNVRLERLMRVNVIFMFLLNHLPRLNVTAT
jgi:hypothetical protein